MTLAEGAGAPNVLIDARYRAIESVIPRVIPVSATLSCTGGQELQRGRKFSFRPPPREAPISAALRRRTTIMLKQASRPSLPAFLHFTS